MAGQIFDRANLVLLPLTIIMVCLIVFTILFEEFLHHLEHKLHQHQAYLDMLQKVYKELMILGFISFFVLLIIEFGTPPADELLMFKFAHVSIFLLAMFFVLHSIVFLNVSAAARQKWDRYEKLKVSHLLRRYEQLSAEDKRRKNNLLVTFCGNSEIFDQMEYHIARSLFLRVHGLPPRFRFAEYLRRAQSKRVSEQLDVDPQTWFILVFIVLLNLCRSLLFSGDDDEFDPETELFMFMVAGWCLLVIVAVLLISLRRAKIRLLRRAGITKMKDIPLNLKNFAAQMDAEKNFLFTHQDLKEHEGINFDRIKLNTYSALVDDVFAYGDPNLFSGFAETLMILQCFYLAIVLILNSNLAFETWGWKLGALYLLAVLVPQAFVVFVFEPFILTKYVFLRSIGHVDLELVKDVAQSMENVLETKYELSVQLRDAMIKKLTKKINKQKDEDQRKKQNTTQVPRALASQHGAYNNNNNNHNNNKNNGGNNNDYYTAQRRKSIDQHNIRGSDFPLSVHKTRIHGGHNREKDSHDADNNNNRSNNDNNNDADNNNNNHSNNDNNNNNDSKSDKRVASFRNLPNNCDNGDVDFQISDLLQALKDDSYDDYKTSSSGDEDDGGDNDIELKIRASLGLRQLFEEYDINKDGHMSKREFAGLLRQMEIDISHHELEQLLSEVDTDLNGKLEYLEFLELASWANPEIEAELNHRLDINQEQIDELNNNNNNKENNTNKENKSNNNKVVTSNEQSDSHYAPTPHHRQSNRLASSSVLQNTAYAQRRRRRSRMSQRRMSLLANNHSACFANTRVQCERCYHHIMLSECAYHEWTCSALVPVGNSINNLRDDNNGDHDENNHTKTRSGDDKNDQNDANNHSIVNSSGHNSSNTVRTRETSQDNAVVSIHNTTTSSDSHNNNNNNNHSNNNHNHNNNNNHLHLHASAARDQYNRLTKLKLSGHGEDPEPLSGGASDIIIDHGYHDDDNRNDNNNNHHHRHNNNHNNHHPHSDRDGGQLISLTALLPKG